MESVTVYSVHVSKKCINITNTKTKQSHSLKENKSHVCLRLLSKDLLMLILTHTDKAERQKIHSMTRVSAKLKKGNAICFSKLRQAQLSRGERRLARREVHLAPWDAFVIEGGHSTDKLKEHGDRCQKLKKEKGLTTKTKETYAHRQELQLAPEGGISLTCACLPLMGKDKDTGRKGTESVCERVFHCLCCR